MDETDSRVKTVVLDARGRELLAAVEAIYADVENEWAEVIGVAALVQTRERLESVLRKRHGGQLPRLRPM